MKTNTYGLVSGLLFLVVALLHLLRVVQGWVITIDTFTLPMWVSMVAVVFVGFLAWTGLRMK